MQKKPKILITGGTGQIGSWLSNYLLENSFDVITLSRNNFSNLDNKHPSHITTDISDLSKLSTSLDNIDFDICIHAASDNKKFSQSSFNINVIGTKNILSLLSKKKTKTKLIYLSTFQVYGRSFGNIDEKTMPICFDDYSTNHLIAEKLIENWVLNSQNSAFILRLSNTYGFKGSLDIDNPKNFIFNMCNMAVLEGCLALTSKREEFRDYIHLDCLCRLIMDLFEGKPNNLVFNISSGVVLSNYEICKKISYICHNITGKKPEIFETFDTYIDNEYLNYKSDLIKDLSDVKFEDRVDKTIEETLRYVFSNNTNI